MKATFVEAAPAAAAQASDESFDDETQRYIAQALTDVDLFSSYGLTQKATHLLENVLQRAPRHTPTLERLLDLYLGAGNERRTVELASQLEQIHREREDTVNADRFAELRQRFQNAAELTPEEMAATPAAPVEAPAAETAEPPAAVETASVAAPLVETSAPSAPVEFEIPLVPVEPEPAIAEAAPAEPQPAAATEEVDLSDEWEAIAQEVAEPAAAAPPAPEPVQAEAQEERIEIEVPEEEPVQAQEAAAEPAAPEPSIEIIEEPAEAARTPETVAAGNGEFELELTPEPAGVQGKAGPATTEDFLSELAAEIDGMEAPAAPPVSTAKPAPVAAASATPAVSTPVTEPTAESLNELAEVFQEFRSELGEMEDEEEDLETHYNLGIAYREMGLLDEAIGEFQKVAKAVQKGKPFPYAMNCSTLLALSFMDKGEPKIASLWYERALELPGLDQEAILALRYDLATALDMAGESTAALDSFRQVYAMNIDYRDVADRIATLQKH